MFGFKQAFQKDDDFRNIGATQPPLCTTPAHRHAPAWAFNPPKQKESVVKPLSAPPPAPKPHTHQFEAFMPGPPTPHKVKRIKRRALPPPQCTTPTHYRHNGDGRLRQLKTTLQQPKTTYMMTDTCLSVSSRARTTQRKCRNSMTRHCEKPPLKHRAGDGTTNDD